MPISRLTAMMLQTNEVTIIDTDVRSEAWIVKNGKPHALMLSCPFDKRQDMEKAIKELKEGTNG
jgi:hypothetical protein